ncbi:hypothetical protein [Halobacteriovorax sp. HLS]|uniref:hypothetical protein n=1 Tax=Halobacteriovorax sp. HLS TaxID=2234000 RepID=UPI000FDAD56B|nr:hypothetical protein [Halobacteriovorax sp. HLS]
MDEIKRKDSLHSSILKQTFIKSALVVLTIALSSCVPSQSGGKKTRGGSSGIVNTAASVNVGYGRVLQDNPIILSGNTALSENVNLSTLLRTQQDHITDLQYLEYNNCAGLTNSTCFEVTKDKLVTKFQATDGKWAFTPSSDEFMQVQMFSDMRSMFEKYNTDLTNFSETAAFLNFENSFPSNMIINNNQWFSQKLVGYAHCDDAPDNAYFSPADKIICLGFDSIYTQVKFVHDPTVLYHELGHALVLNAMNLRNRAKYAAGTFEESYLGYFSYDEARSINEGLADYFSYYMNGRPFLGEWAFGRFLELGRPMSESDSIHAPGISETSEGRLSYPTFLGYDANNPTAIHEDVHYAGQIISHFLVAFTKDVESSCSYTNDAARSLTFNLIVQTLAYLGDISSEGLDATHSGAPGFVNHSAANSLEWIKKNKPITYRRFAQTFARFVKTSIGSTPALCNGLSYNIQNLESLLDSYGLLLFKNYDLNGSKFVAEAVQKVNELNRQKTVLIKKNQLFLENRENKPKAYIFDGFDDMNSAAASLSSGTIEGTLSPTIFENNNLKYNNGNSLISPGELVGVLINLYNNSNSEMAGVRILANDWDHMDGTAPCNNFSDNFPSSTQGGVSVTTNPPCGVETQDNSTTAPVCFFQDTKDDATVWVGQEEYMTSRAIEATECLGGASSTKDCLIRSPKGADVAWYSKINAKQTWLESFTDANGKTKFNFSNIFFLEVSPSIPPGTTVNCRLRANFTNCDDCFNTSTTATGNTYTPHVNSGLEFTDDELKDYKYSGADPFVIINYTFTIID